MTNNKDLLKRYELGKWFLDQRAARMESEEHECRNWDSLAKGQPARVLMERLAEQRQVSLASLKSASQFAEAVDTLLTSCGSEAFQTLFSRDIPQSENSILRLSRTSDVRQRHRVSGVQAGLFRSVGPQSDDVVFDTVAFGEVTSRLARARGVLQKLNAEWHGSTDSVADEALFRLIDLVHESALQLRKFLNSNSTKARPLPRNLEKAAVCGELKSLAGRNKQTGRARLALRFIIKCVWDYPEMRRREIAPTTAQREQALRELRVIADIAASLQDAVQPAKKETMTVGESVG